MPNVKTSTDIKITSSEQGSGKHITTTITDVNPSASAAVLVQFARQLNALTTNTYVETNQVVTTRLDDVEGEASNNG